MWYPGNDMWYPGNDMWYPGRAIIMFLRYQAIKSKSLF